MLESSLVTQTKLAYMRPAKDVKLSASWEAFQRFLSFIICLFLVFFLLFIFFYFFILELLFMFFFINLSLFRCQKEELKERVPWIHCNTAMGKTSVAALLSSGNNTSTRKPGLQQRFPVLQRDFSYIIGDASLKKDAAASPRRKTTIFS